MQSSTLAKRGSILLFIVFILFYFYGLGHLPFVGPDESRYAQVAREMFLHRDWITPTLAGYFWFEKPVLLYWLEIVAFKLFGISEWSARAASALCGLLTVAAIFWIARRTERTQIEISDLKSEISKDPSDLESEGPKDPRAAVRLSRASLGFWSALVAGTSGGLIAFSRAVSFDIVVTMTIAWALAFFFAAELEVDPKPRRRLLLVFYIAIGLSLLAKGLVGFVVPLGVIGAYYTLRGNAPVRDLRLSILWGLPLSLAVAAVWYGPMLWKHGAPFFNEFIIRHHFQRYATNKYRHPAAIYYYLEILPLLALPWSAFLVDGILKARKAFWKGSDDPVNKLQTFALAWIFLPLIFFSLSGSKLPGYILPVLPAVALIAGVRLAQFDGEAKNHWAIKATGGMALVFAIGVLLFSFQSGKISVRAGLAMAALSAIVGIFALLLRRRWKTAVVMTAAATLVIVLVGLHSVAPGLADTESTRRLIQLADQRGYGGALLFGLQRDDRSPEFYAAGRVVYGDDHEPIMYDGIGQVIYESHARKKTVLFLIPLRDLNTLMQKESVRSDVIANNGRVAIVAITPL
ncbi:MAG: ArnT family glycosyltransferase [Pyrinomonadaceae bacterium]